MKKISIENEDKIEFHSIEQWREDFERITNHRPVEPFPNNRVPNSYIYKLQQMIDNENKEIYVNDTTKNDE